MQIFRRKRGQVTVELMLILPVFMLMIFFVLEYGNLAYRTLILNHASYEFARIGALVGANKPSGKPNKGTMASKINAAKQRVFGVDSQRIQVRVDVRSTGKDPMYKKHQHDDVIVTVIYPIRLAFPGTSWLLATEPKKDGIRRIRVSTRMPVEKVYASSDMK